MNQNVMRIAVVYIFANAQASKYEPMARRFSQTYMDNPPGLIDHELYVVVNGGGKITERQERLFDPLVPQFLYHNNSAKDIGAYFMVARTVPCDYMVCIGGPVRPRMAGWLDALVRALEENGPGVFGPWGFHVPSTHLRTTVFAITPQLMNDYPYKIADAQRYAFEHGPDSIALWCLKNGFQAMQVTARGVFDVAHWHYVDLKDNYFLDQHIDQQVGTR